MICADAEPAKITLIKFYEEFAGESYTVVLANNTDERSARVISRVATQ